MIDNTPRIVKVLDALSQMANVALLPGHRETHANESISGRSHRMGWRLRHVINALFFWQEDHCRMAHEKDVERARATIAAQAQVRQ
jgi:hypothetical protein